MKNTLKRSLALLLVLLFAIPTFAFAEDLGVEAVSVEDIALVEDVATDDVVVEQAEEPVEDDNLDLAEENTILGEEFAETNEVAESNDAPAAAAWTVAMHDNVNHGGSDMVSATFDGASRTFSGAVINCSESNEPIGRDATWYLGVEVGITNEEALVGGATCEWGDRTITLTDADGKLIPWNEATHTGFIKTEGDAYSWFGLWMGVSPATITAALKGNGVITKTLTLTNGEDDVQTIAIKADVKNITLQNHGGDKTLFKTQNGVIITDEVQEYKISFNLDGEPVAINGQTKVTYKPGQTIAQIYGAAPSASKKIFDGWYTDAAMNAAAKIEHSAVIPASLNGATLYGALTDEICTVTFVRDAEFDEGDNPSKDVEINVPAGRIIDATNAAKIPVPDPKDGYDVSKGSDKTTVLWYTDLRDENSYVDFSNEIIDRDLTVYAKYIPWTAKVYFNVGEDASPMDTNPMTVTYGANNRIPNATWDANHKFEKWVIGAYEPAADETDVDVTKITATEAAFDIDDLDDLIKTCHKNYKAGTADESSHIYLCAKFTGVKYKVYFMNGSKKVYQGEEGAETPYISVDADKTLEACHFYESAEAKAEAEDVAGVVIAHPADTATTKFDGWYADEDLTIPFKFATDKVTADNTYIYAKMAPKTFTVQFYAEDAVPELQEKVVEYNDYVAEPEEPKMDGKVFDAWYLEGTTTKFKFTTAIKQNYKLTAGWKDLKLTVKFEGEGVSGNTYRDRTVVWGNALGDLMPRDPVLTGYEFLGWYVGEEKFDPATKIKEDTTLTAKYQRTHTITFNLNKGTYKTGNPGTKLVLPETVAVTEKVLKPYDCTKTSGSDTYILDAWYTDKDLNNPFAVGSTLSEDVTLYAGYVLGSKVEFAVANNTSATAPATQWVKRGGYATQPADLPTTNGAAFLGWFADSTGKTAFNFATTAINTDTKVWALYDKKATTKTVTILDYSVEGTPKLVFADSKLANPQYVVSGEYAIAPTEKDLAKPGWTFTGLYKGNTPFAIESTAITTDTTLYARYTKDVYNINFVIDGETVASFKKERGEEFDEYYDYDELKKITDAIEKKGITVTKWTYPVTVETTNKYTGEKETKEETRSFASHWDVLGDEEEGLDPITFTQDTTITATITTAKFNVTFYTEENGTFAKQSVEYGKTATRPATDPTASGKLFDQWYTYDKKGKEVVFDFSTPITEHTYVYGKFKNKATVSVSMKGWAVGGTASEPIVSVKPESQKDFAVVEYKLSTADDSTYTPTKPTAPGTYTVRVSLENKTYKAVPDTATFTIAAAAVTDPSKEFVTTVTTEANGDVVVTVTKDGKEVSKVTAKPGEAASSDEIKITQKVNADGTVTVTIEPGANASYTFPAYTVTSTTSIQLPVPAISSLKCAKKRKVTVSWTALTDIDGYEIVWGKTEAAAKKMTPVDVPGAATASVKVKVAKKLKGKKVLFFIRSYKTVGGQKIYSAWSASKKSGKIKK